MKCKIDARGLACPQPVVLTKDKMKEYNEIEIIVDNQTAQENIKRLASTSGWAYEDSISNNFINIILKKNNITTVDKKSSQEIVPSFCGNEGTIVVFSSNKMGKGDDDLGAILMKAFIHTLLSLESVPSKLIFYNSGVLLATNESGVVDDLQALQDKGVEILICGTCANYYNIGDKIKTGIISNMFDILNTMNNAMRIINP